MIVYCLILHIFFFPVSCIAFTLFPFLVNIVLLFSAVQINALLDYICRLVQPLLENFDHIFFMVQRSGEEKYSLKILAILVDS